MDLWGVGTAIIAVTTGVICLAIGYCWGASEAKPKRNSWEAPGRCTWEPIEQPTQEKSLAEREYDEMIEYYQKEHP